MNRIGDWTCVCGEINFKIRDNCRKCTNSKTLIQTTQNVEQGDWKCGCGEINFKNRTQCRKCFTNKARSFDKVITAKFTTNFEPGDWKCNCGETNFKTRDVCRKCSNPKSNITHEYKYEEGDWKCKCGEMNFKSRLQCRKCHTTKDDIVNETNSKLEVDPLVCAICMTNPKNILLMTCKHLMCCSLCVTLLRKKECPICRVAFTERDLVEAFV